MIINKTLLNKNIFFIILIIITLAITTFLLLLAPNNIKAGYVLFMYLFFIMVAIFAVVRKKQEFLIFIFIVSLSFTAFNINIKKYLPILGYYVPWITIADILLLFMVTIELVKISMRKTKLIFPLAINKPFLLLIGSILFSYLFVAPHYYSDQFSGYTPGFFSLILVIRGYLIFLYFYNYLDNTNKYKIIIMSFAFVVMMQFGFMLYQWLTGDFLSLINIVYTTIDDSRIEKYGIARKAFGTFNYPSIAAGVIIIIYPISIAFTTLKITKSKVLTLCKYLIIIFSPFCILLSGGRAALVAMFFVAPIILLIIAKRYRQNKFNKYIIAFLLSTIFIGLLASGTLPLIEHWKERFSYEVFVENSLNFRLLIYKIGMRALESNPLLGVGWGNGDTYAFDLLKNKEVALYTVGLHNGYVSILIENGIIGLCIYFIWYISLLRASYRYNNNYDLSAQFAFLGGIFTMVIIQMVLIDTQGVLLKNQAEYMHFCLCLSFLRGYDNSIKHSEKII